MTAERHAAQAGEGDGTRCAARAPRRWRPRTRRGARADAAARAALEREAKAARLVEAAGSGVAQARVAELEAELERRASVQARVGSELSALRDELASVREARLGRNEWPSSRSASARRARSWRAARPSWRPLRSELDEARLEASARAAALREAERAADELRREAAELRRRMEDERRRRFAMEAELRAELEREREELGARLASAEGTL